MPIQKSRDLDELRDRENTTPNKRSSRYYHEKIRTLELARKRKTEIAQEFNEYLKNNMEKYK